MSFIVFNSYIRKPETYIQHSCYKNLYDLLTGNLEAHVTYYLDSYLNESIQSKFFHKKVSFHKEVKIY